MVGPPRPRRSTDVLLDNTLAIGAIDAIRPTRIDRLDILPADGRLAECTVLLANETGRERRLSIALRSVEDSYGVCVVDSPPQLSLLTVNILKAATEVLVPIDPGLFAIAGLGRLQETVEKVRHHLQHPDLSLAGLLITRATKNKITGDLERQLREAYGELVYRAVIPASVKIEEAHASYRSILEWDPKSPVGKAYDELVTEVLNGPSKRQNTTHARNRKRGPRSGNAA